MHTTVRRTFPLTLMAALACAPLAHAQDTAGPCPALPAAGADLVWTDMQAGDLHLCRAIDAQGREAFAVTISRDSPFKPQRALREEAGRFGDETLWWYRSEIAGRPDELVRETLLDIDRNRVAHVVIRTESPAELKQYQNVVENLRFGDPGLAQR